MTILGEPKNQQFSNLYLGIERLTQFRNKIADSKH